MSAIQASHFPWSYIKTLQSEVRPAEFPGLMTFRVTLMFFFSRWRMNNGDVDLTNDRYSMVGGNLVINNPDKQKDAGIYYCLASNNYGMVRSTEATLSFGCKSSSPF